MHRSRRFTLIELLVVVAIIGVLASMLLPALSRARAAAKGTTCMNNMRSIYHGFATYADVFDENYPSPAVQGSTGSDADWHLKLGEAGGWGDPVLYDGLNHNFDDVGKQIYGWEILKCPSETGSALGTNQPYYRWEHGRTSYAASVALCPRNNGGYWGTHITRRSWSSGPTFSGSGSWPAVVSTSDAAIVMDIHGASNRWTTAQFGSNIDSTSATNLPRYLYAFRHNDAANQLYWDGHAGKARHFAITGVKLWQYFSDRGPTASFPGATAAPWDLY